MKSNDDTLARAHALLFEATKGRPAASIEELQAWLKTREAQLHPSQMQQLIDIVLADDATFAEQHRLTQAQKIIDLVRGG